MCETGEHLLMDRERMRENEEDTLALSRRNMPDQLTTHFGLPGLSNRRVKPLASATGI